MLQQLKDASANSVWGGTDGRGGPSSQGAMRRRYSLVRPDKFTNDGLKERNDAVVASLYEVGLPYVCSADGRRFASQLELSKHLDALFRRSQLEKTMERTEERGWYPEEGTWTAIGSAKRGSDAGGDDAAAATAVGDGNPSDGATDATSPSGAAVPSSVLADENRDRCLLCGINFDMHFDQEDGEWKYGNCVERSVERDGPTMDGDESTEAVLVHVSCWEGLGSPEYLTADQLRHVS